MENQAVLSSPGPAPILVAVDATNLVHRAHHAFGSSDRRSPNGAPVWALWGLARMLSTAMAAVTTQFRAPVGLTLCFDGPHETCHRRAMDATYKASRKTPDPDLVSQMGVAPSWLTDCGFNVETFDGYEADDGCASAASFAAKNGWRAVIVTSDRDALAHTSSATRVLRPVNGGGWDVYSTARISEKYGTPNTHGVYASFAALRGDPADELPGVAGVGDKTAAAVLCALDEVARTVTDVIAGDEVASAALTPRALKLITAGAGNYERNRKMMDAVLTLGINLDAASAPLDPAHIAESCAYRGVIDAEELLVRCAPALAEPSGSEF